VHGICGGIVGHHEDVAMAYFTWERSQRGPVPAIWSERTFATTPATRAAEKSTILSQIKMLEGENLLPISELVKRYPPPASNT
jgi:hypothetical protein